MQPGWARKESQMELSRLACAQCQTPVSKDRFQLLSAHPGQWFACETDYCDWVHVRTYRGQIEFSSQADARVHAIPLRGEPRSA
jgi:hypothetical protein